jgi:transcriptional regulator with XRE-family HTH domain
MRHKPIAEQLKAWRADRGLSQHALAERTGMTDCMIARFELGQTDPRLSTLERLAEALGIRLVDLFTEPKASRPRKKRAGRR